MSDMAKQARAAMKAKASRLTSADPHQKVDSSTWTPPEALNADVKTGLRPISRRAFKSGGKVSGGKAKANLGKATRGGNKPITPNNFANKDVKAANEDRMGLKHVGGLKRGGKALRKGRDDGGKVDEIAKYLEKDDTPEPARPGQGAYEQMPDVTPEQAKRMRERGHMNPEKARCWGGKTKKATGGALAGAEEMMKKAQQTSGVPSATLGFTGIKKGALSPLRATGMKKGGMAHEDVKADMALIKKMVKPASLRKGRADGGETNADQALPELEAKLPQKYIVVDREGVQYGGPYASMKTASRAADKRDNEYGAVKYRVVPMKAHGGRAARKEGGGVFSGESYPGKIPGVVPGGRIARATGGKTKGKGKTNINILIATGAKKPGMDGMMPPPGMDAGAPQGMPVPVPPPQGGMPGGMPMPVPMPMPMPAAGPAPTARKSGGRLTAKASSYKDMTAGAGSGEGRLQKTDVAKARMGRKTGGKAYRSYKDMDAGAGSGMGRLEKTEIQARKK